MTRERAVFWTGLLLAPAAWVLYIFVAWTLVPVACDEGVAPTMHLFAALAFLAAVAGLIVATRARRQGGGRDSFLAQLGILLAALFVLGVVVAWAFNFFIDPCA